MNGEKHIGIGTHILVLKDNKVLLGKRVGNFIGTWSMPGGKLDFGEDLEDCAVRELLEETGLKAKSLQFISLSDNIDMIDTESHFVTIGFLCTEFEGSLTVMEPLKITDWTWFDLNILPSPLFSTSAKVLEYYQTKIPFKKK
jgi:8-oxo-dGTP diphosphatase